MKMTKNTFKLFVCVTLYCAISGCRADIESKDDHQMVLDPAYEDLLTTISCFEKENHFVTDVPTRKAPWGFVVAADASPLVLGTGFGNVGIFMGAVFGIINSLYVAFFVNNEFELMENQRLSGINWAEEVVCLKEHEVDNTEIVGAVHNAVLQQLFYESETVDYSEVSDWELYKIIEQKVADYLPEESTSITQSQYQQLRELFPDSREYIDFDAFANACLNDYPGFEEDYMVAFRVLSTIIAQDSDEQLDSYEKGVIQLIKDSSISEESKKGLIGTVSVQKASKEFWYE
jgi:hypothetical protein